MKRGAVIGRRQKPSSKPPWPTAVAVRVRSRHKDFHKIFVQCRLMWLHPDTTFSHKKTGNICGQGPLTEPLISSTLRLLAERTDFQPQQIQYQSSALAAPHTKTSPSLGKPPAKALKRAAGVRGLTGIFGKGLEHLAISQGPILAGSTPASMLN